MAMCKTVYLFLRGIQLKTEGVATEDTAEKFC